MGTLSECLSLPLEIWIEFILPYLRKHDILNLALTCKDICGIVINDKVWMQFYNQLSKRCRKLRRQNVIADNRGIEGGYYAKCVSYGKERQFDKFMKTRRTQRRWINARVRKIEKLENQLGKEKTLLEDAKTVLTSTFC